VITQRAIDAIEVSDLDELLRVVDGFCETAGWDELVELRARCQEAVTRGKQLWGVDEHIRYRLALEAPPSFAGPVLSEGAARFALGPLPEVASSTKTWSDLEPHIEHGPERATFAAERAVRGEFDVDDIADLPTRIQEWEPSYALATYKSDKVDAPSPKPPDTKPIDLGDKPTVVADADSEGALADLVQAWTTESNGRCETITVEGSAADAVRALGLSKANMARLRTDEAFAWMAWAGASGGAHGRRRGAAAGRYGAWWAVAMLCDLDWPPDLSVFADSVNRLRFYWFDDGAPGTGWQLRLAIEDPDTGLAWSVSAVDSAD
jgi:hypothetical protein